MELQQLTSIRSRPLRKEHHRQPGIQRRVHLLPCLHPRPPTTSRDINGPTHPRPPPRRRAPPPHRPGPRQHNPPPQSNPPPGGSKKIHQIESSSLSPDSVSQRSLSCQKCSPTSPTATTPPKLPLPFTTTGSTAASLFPSSHYSVWEPRPKSWPGASPPACSSASTPSSPAQPS